MKYKLRQRKAIDEETEEANESRLFTDKLRKRKAIEEETEEIRYHRLFSNRLLKRKQQKQLNY